MMNSAVDFHSIGDDGLFKSADGARWTKQFSQVEKSVSASCSGIESYFGTIAHDCSEQKRGGARLPSPIRMMRRLTALEIAIAQLRHDCDNISEKRDKLVTRILADQNTNMSSANEIVMKSASKSITVQTKESDWDHVSHEMRKQMDLLTPNRTSALGFSPSK